MQVPLIKTKTSFTLFLERLSIQSTRWIGSTQSLATHTVLFLFCFVLIIAGFNSDKIMLILTTIVSLEAIYLSIFIQMSVNRQARRLREVSRDIEEISEDVEGIQKDVEEIQGDVEGIQEDVEEISEDVEGIQKDVEEIQEDVEEISEDEEEEEENDPQFDQIKKTLETLLEEVAQLKGTKAKKLVTPRIANKK
jgi:uncharacterized protein YoxC